MPKAHITTKTGMKVTVEGNLDEIETLVRQLQSLAGPAERLRPTRRIDVPKSKQKPTLGGLVSSLIDGGFFRKPKDLAAIKAALAELGHVYPITTLSPTMLRLVRRRHLRRIKEKNRWLYTG